MAGKVLVIVGCIFSLVAMALFIFTIVMLQYCDIVVIGTIVDEVIDDTEEGIFYRPVYEYESNGVTKRITGGAGSYPRNFRFGDTAEIRLSSKDPNITYIPGEQVVINMFCLMFGIIGVLFLGSGAVVVKRHG